jgi:hypothetical protein
MLHESQLPYLLALAQAFSGLLAIAFGLLVFIAQRTVRRYRAGDPTYQLNLILTMGASASTALLTVLSWSTWDAAAPHGVHLLLDWDSRTWLAIVFGSGTVAAGGCLITATVGFVRSRSESGGPAA